jgi:LysM repeat protein
VIHSKKAVLFLVLFLMGGLGAAPLPDDAVPPTGYDLAAAVNAYRAANGYYELSPNTLVMSAAQTHAEWIVNTGQGGHIGADGSDETIRVSWTGYGGGATIQCDENWAGGSNINDVIYGAWSDWVHQEVMLNAWGNLYTDIGGGVAASGEGRYVFILNVCKVVGQEFSGAVPESSEPAPNATTDPLATADVSNYVYGVTTATPMADGTVKHTVLYGQTLSSIAEAYGITINALRELNNMGADATIIFPEQELLIQTATSPIEAQGSAVPETEASPIPSPTAVAQTQTLQPTPAATEESFTATALAAQETADEKQTLPPLGLFLVVFFGVGLVGFLIFSADRK